MSEVKRSVSRWLLKDAVRAELGFSKIDPKYDNPIIRSVVKGLANDVAPKKEKDPFAAAKAELARRFGPDWEEKLERGEL